MRFPFLPACAVLAPVAVGGALFLLSPQPSSRAQAPAPPSDAAADLAALKKDVEILKGKAPDQSHAMKDVAYHFTNLWFAGSARNWPLAKFYADETRAHLRWAVRIIPVRKVSGGDLDLRTMLDGLDQTVFTALSKSIDAKSDTEFPTAYRQAMAGCYSCHTAAEKPFLRLKLPEQPEARIVDFSPAP